jgi:hypothetical protein
MAERLPTYSAFWPYYLREHSKPLTRGIHYVGTALAIGCALAGLAVDARYFCGVPLAGYGFAWAAHFFVEKNRPATFTYPAWSLVSDFRLFGLFITGRLAPHLAAAGVFGENTRT